MKNIINTFEKLLNTCNSQNKQIYEIMQETEAYNLELTINEIRKKVQQNINVMKECIRNGLSSKEKSFSGLSGDDCYKLQKRYSVKNALFGSLYEKITAYALATIEENIRMGKIVACPTAGSCGIVSAVIIALSENFNLSEEKEINALITAGTIGYIISHKVSLSGAVAGCQAECGVASAMAASACTYILNGSTEQIIHSAILAIKNLLGLTCDPVAGLVEIPCVKRNSFLAVHSITASELALSDIKSQIPPDEVIDSLQQTGQLMSPLLKESAQAGLAKTKTAKIITKNLLMF